MVADLGEGGVGVRRDATAAGDVAMIRKRGDGHFDAGAAQEVNGREDLDLFKSFGQQGECGGHGKQKPLIPTNEH